MSRTYHVKHHLNIQLRHQALERWRAAIPWGYREPILRAFIDRCGQERLFPDDIAALAAGDYSIRSALNEAAKNRPIADPPPGDVGD